MSTKIITAPLEEPITLEQARQYLRASLTDEDSLILSLIFAAREYAENFTERAFVTQTWELSLDAFPRGREIEIPKGQLQSVTSVKYIDENEAEQTLAASVYDVDATRDPGRIVLAEDESWPVTDDQPNAVVIRFVCGYGGSSAVPYSIKAALQLLVQYVEQRDVAPHLASAAEALLGPYRILRA
jgi:uncharacterized phiE125 gp8 family phage protein